MVRKAVIGAIVVLIALPLVAVMTYDLVLWRWGYKQTGWCERTLESSADFWGLESSAGDQVDLSGSSDYRCDACSIAFTRSPRIVLDDVDQARSVVQPCGG